MKANGVDKAAQEVVRAKPFLKWAGGKTQLLPAIEQLLSPKAGKGGFTYVEPFVGSGAVLFWVLDAFPQIERAVINDLNGDLINTYRVIATTPYELIERLEVHQEAFHQIDGDEEAKKAYFYSKRTAYNSRQLSLVEQAAHFIFLNRTCFNGLYRVNAKNQFNVPAGVYKKPTICNAENLLAVHHQLQKVVIMEGDFAETLKYADENVIFYIDPPYKPISKTSSFTAYSKFEFDDQEQVRLKQFCDDLHQKGSHWVLSNSDVKGVDIGNEFFDDLYANYQIQRVEAKRMINSNVSRRGVLTELLINN